MPTFTTLFPRALVQPLTGTIGLLAVYGMQRIVG